MVNTLLKILYWGGDVKLMIHHLTFINATDYIRKPGNSIANQNKKINNTDGHRKYIYFFASLIGQTFIHIPHLTQISSLI